METDTREGGHETAAISDAWTIRLVVSVRRRRLQEDLQRGRSRTGAGSTVSRSSHGRGLKDAAPASAFTRLGLV